MIRNILLAIFTVLFVNTAFCQSVDSTLIISDYAFSLVNNANIQKDITSSLKGFLDNIDNGSRNNPFIDPVYIKKDMEPFSWFIIYDNDAKSTNSKINTIVLSVLPIENASYLIKLQYMDVTNPCNKKLVLIGSLITKMVGNKYYFYNAVDHYTRFWIKQKIGTINYVSATNVNQINAEVMNKFNVSLARKFGIKPIQITYYKFEDPEQLFKIMGFDYIPNMYYSTSGGLAQQWKNTLLAGNNSELYEHEAVHFYTATLFPNRSKVADEGYATFLGGSGGKNLNQLAPFAKNYIKNHPEKNITELATDFGTVVEGNVPITYILSALICRDIEHKYGMNGIKKLLKLNAGEDYFNNLYKVNKIDKTNFGSYMNGLLREYN